MNKKVIDNTAAWLDPGEREDFSAVRIIVPGDPHGQPRAGVQTGRGRRPRFYSRSKIVQYWRQTIRDVYRTSSVVHAGNRALRIRLVFFFPRPQRLMRKEVPPGRIPYTKKPDIDNVSKAVLDALNGVAYDDDAQVYDLRVQKWYVGLGAGGFFPPCEPHTQIEIIADGPSKNYC